MLKQVATISDRTLAETSRDISFESSSQNSQSELEAFTSYFELLSQIDQRLTNEDPEYREKYYPVQNLGKER